MLAKKNKGVALIEPIIAIFIFTLTIICFFTVLNVNKISIENEKGQMKGIFAIEAIEKNISCNYTFNFIKDILGEKTIYIGASDIEEEKYKYILQSQGDNYRNFFPYVEIKGNMDRTIDVLKITITYYMDQEKKISHVFYKGNYEKDKGIQYQ